MNDYVILIYLNPKFTSNVIKILVKYTHVEPHPSGSGVMLKGAKVVDIKGHNIEKLIEISTIDDGDCYRYPGFSWRHFTILETRLLERSFKCETDDEAKLIFEVYDT